MTLRRVEPGQARLLALAVEYDFPKRTEDWLEHLKKGELTEEMQNVFEAFGYLEKRAKRQSRPRIATSPSPLTDPNELAAALRVDGIRGRSSASLPSDVDTQMVADVETVHAAGQRRTDEHRADSLFEADEVEGGEEPPLRAW